MTHFSENIPVVKRRMTVYIAAAAANDEATTTMMINSVLRKTVDIFQFVITNLMHICFIS
jgi:hypothetical protein